MRDIKKFILDTLLPYREDPSRCAVVIDKEGIPRCKYLTDDGRMCAIGKHMKKGIWQKEEASICDILEVWYLEEILTDEAISMGFSEGDWETIQIYHDKLATDRKMVNSTARVLECRFNIELPELRIKE